MITKRQWDGQLAQMKADEAAEEERARQAKLGGPALQAPAAVKPANPLQAALRPRAPRLNTAYGLDPEQNKAIASQNILTLLRGQ